MKRRVVIYRSADRHADLHDRQFGVTEEVEVEDGPIEQVAQDAVRSVDDRPCSRWVVTIFEPHE